MIFNDFDGFAKHHPSTLKFRETMMVSRNHHGFDGHTGTQLTRPTAHTGLAVCRSVLKNACGPLIITDSTQDAGTGAGNPMARHGPQPARLHQLRWALREEQRVAWRRRVCSDVFDLWA